MSSATTAATIETVSSSGLAVVNGPRRELLRVDEVEVEEEEEVDETDAASSSITTTAADLGDYEDDNHDDYIREFSFEPEIILGRRTGPNLFTCSADVAAATPSSSITSSSPFRPPLASFPSSSTTSQGESEQKSNSSREKYSSHNQYRALFRPKSLALSLCNRYRPPVEASSAPPPPQPTVFLSTNSIIIPRQQYSGTTRRYSQSDDAGPSTEDVRTVQFAGIEERAAAKRRLKCDEDNAIASDRLCEVRIEKEISGVQKEEDNCDDPERGNPVKGRTRKSRWRRGWLHEKGARSVQQVHHEIEAFYYVGTEEHRRNLQRLWFYVWFCEFCD